MVKDIWVVTDEYNISSGDGYDVGILAYIDLSNGVLKKGPGEITINDSFDAYMTPEGIEPEHIYHIKAVLIKENSFLVTKIVERDVKNSILELLLEEYNKTVIFNDDILGTITLEYHHACFFCEVSWLDYKIDLTIWAEEITSKVINILHKAYEDFKVFVKQIQRNVTKKLYIQELELQVFPDGWYSLSARLYTLLHKGISITTSLTTEDGEPSYDCSLFFRQKLRSIKETSKMFDVLNTLGMGKSAINNNKFLIDFEICLSF